MVIIYFGFVWQTDKERERQNIEVDVCIIFFFSENLLTMLLGMGQILRNNVDGHFCVVCAIQMWAVAAMIMYGDCIRNGNLFSETTVHYAKTFYA